jgi:hypothetical protein
LSRADAQIGLFFLAANAITHLSPVDDPWFSAHRNINHTTIYSQRSGTNETYVTHEFGSDSYVRVLACADQYQICNPKTDQCTPLDSAGSTIGHLPTLGINQYQKQTANIILSSGPGTFQSPEVVYVLGSDALLASRQLIPGSGSVPLPKNQWMVEVSSWFAISLAGLQQGVVEYATGPSPAYLMTGQIEDLYTPGDPNSTVMGTLCNSQKVKSTGEYQNFSVLGLCCILIGGSIIMLLSLNIETLAWYVQSKMNRGEEGRRQWMADSNFQVQRMLYEGRGYEKWKGQKDAVPVYLGDNLQFPVELVDGRFGLLRRRSTETIEGSGPKEEAGLTDQIKETGSENRTVTSFEGFAADEVSDQNVEAQSTVEMRAVPS